MGRPSAHILDAIGIRDDGGRDRYHKHNPYSAPAIRSEEPRESIVGNVQLERSNVGGMQNVLQEAAASDGSGTKDHAIDGGLGAEYHRWFAGT